MKKIIFFIALVLAAMGANAQRVGEVSVWSENNSDFNHSGFFFNPAIGVQVGDTDTDFGISLQLGYRWHIANGISWDILKVGANTGVSNFNDMIDLRFLSGIRYNSPALFGNHGIYGEFALGYNFMTQNTDLGGFAYEIGVGVNITRTVSLGLIWEGSCASYEYYYRGYSYDQSYHWGIFGLRLGLNF